MKKYPMRKYDYQERYERWWLKKDVRFHDGDPWKRCTGVTLIGPPSFVYGCVELEFADGAKRIIPTKAFRPRKWDVQVRETSPTE